jgi:hypothetical protein
VQITSGCRFADELKTRSVVLRHNIGEREANAMIWVPKKAGVKRRRELSYIKVIEHHTYDINLTFGPGSTIAQLVGVRTRTRRHCSPNDGEDEGGS